MRTPYAFGAVVLAGALGALAIIGMQPRPELARLEIAGSKISGEFENSGQIVTTIRCENRDGKALDRVTAALQAAGAKFSRHTEWNSIYQLDEFTTASIGRAPKFLGVSGKDYRYQTATGRVYTVPIANLKGRSPTNGDLAVVLVRRAPRVFTLSDLSL